MRNSIITTLSTANAFTVWLSTMIVVTGLLVLCPPGASALNPVPIPQDLQSDVLIWADFREDLSGPQWYYSRNTNTPQLDNVYVWDYPWNPNALIYDFGEKVTKIRVFPIIDHYNYWLRADAQGDAYEYDIYASNDPGGPWVEIVSPIANNGRIDTGYYNYDYAIKWSATGIGTHLATYPDGWYTANIWAHLDDYTADYDLGGSFRYIKIDASIIGDRDPEMDAIGALALAVIRVPIDIKPGSDPNSINIDSRGVIPVAILTTGEFDAAEVNPDTVLFGPLGAYPEHYAMEDVDYDGDIDMILHFRTQDTGIAHEDTEAVLTGETYDGRKIEGSDSVRVLERKGSKK